MKQTFSNSINASKISRSAFPYFNSSSWVLNKALIPFEILKTIDFMSVSTASATPLKFAKSSIAFA
jgi:hypothetical protein